MPLAKELLNTTMQVPAAIQVGESTWTISQTPQFILEVEQTRKGPINDCIPDNLGDHHLCVTHERILLLIRNEPDFAQDEEKLIVGSSQILDIFSIQMLCDEITHQAIADGNQIATRRVKGVDGDRRFAGETPALLGIDLFAAIGIILHHTKVLDLLPMLFNNPCTLRLALAKPGKCPLKEIELFKRMDLSIRNNPDARCIGG